ncbi:MAG: RNA polymerase sigma factor [Rikenellaceae bacterium]|nr:RNA polymerase sigma factor [Rikenellaceae bacterium]MBQ5853037.1 RNA polymerase sigma factor [Rikenellaceae bacterium]MBQ5894476.1 RNA polymerase sigma factor [Rikenellaceae bacterium]
MEIADYIVADDAQLVDWVLGGDKAAFEYLFNRYGESIRRLYVQRLGNSSDVDDLLQETFIKVFINLARYDRGYTFGQWAYTIARNTLIDYVRKRHDDLSIDALPTHSTVTPASTVPTPEESVISLQQRGRIEHHLDRMTPRYRLLIEYRFFLEYSYEEIAEKLSLPLGTVKTQIHRAREQLCRFIVEDKM